MLNMQCMLCDSILCVDVATSVCKRRELRKSNSVDKSICAPRMAKLYVCFERRLFLRCNSRFWQCVFSAFCSARAARWYQQMSESLQNLQSSSGRRVNSKYCCGGASCVQQSLASLQCMYTSQNITNVYTNILRYMIYVNCSG